MDPTECRHTPWMCDVFTREDLIESDVTCDENTDIVIFRMWPHSM